MAFRVLGLTQCLVPATEAESKQAGDLAQIQEANLSHADKVGQSVKQMLCIRSQVRVR